MNRILQVLLFIVAVILMIVVGLFCTVLLILLSIITEGNQDYFLRLAVGVDQFGNIFISPFANIGMRKRGGARFGDPDETISSVLGKLYVKEKLTPLSAAIRVILDWLDEDHCRKSINNKVGDKI